MIDSHASHFADYLSVNENGIWVRRWCSLSRNQLNVFTDREAALSRPDRPLQIFSLRLYQHVEVSGKYNLGKAHWEMTLSGETPSQLRPWNESNDSLAINTNWSNRVTSKSKRLYQLVSGSASTQTLSAALPEATKSHKAVFRAMDGRSITQWADAINENLSAAPLPTLMRDAVPSHARIRRSRPTTANTADDYSESYSNRDSSMISAAALASRRKRLDSLGRTLDGGSATQLSRSDPDSFSRSTARPFTAADKFIKASRRVSVEVFASAMGNNRKSIDEQSNRDSRPTTSSGTSMRSSICCPGLDSKRVSLDNKAATTVVSPNFTSFATFSSPFVSTIRKSASRRKSASSHGSNRSSVHFDPTTLASIGEPTSLRPTSVLASSASAFDISFSSSHSGGDVGTRERSSSFMTRSTSFSPCPPTPTLPQVEEVSGANDDQDRNKSFMSRSMTTALGLSLYDAQRFTPADDKKVSIEKPFSFRPNIAHAIIVESPTNEDLATLIAKGEEAQKATRRGELSTSPLASKLAVSPSMPALNQTYNRGNDGEDQSAAKIVSGMTSSPSSRFASLSKLSGRRTGLLGFKRSPSPKIQAPMAQIEDSTRLGPGSSMRRPATSSGLRTVVSSPQLDEAHRRDGDNDAAIMNISAPTVERILPPQEIIATIDRLKKQHSASSLPTSSRSTTTLSDYASNRRNVVLPDWRDAKGEIYRPRPTRPVRPELQSQSSVSSLRKMSPALPPPSTLTTSHTFNELGSYNRQIDLGFNMMSSGDDRLNRLGEQRAQSPSLPVPPRMNRRIHQITPESPAQYHRRMSSREDKENTYISRMSESKKPMMTTTNTSQGMAARPRRPLRSSISENFALRSTAQAH